jgi:Skp family chaperone for outer membrane proteins
MVTLGRFTLALITTLVPLSAFAQALVVPDPSQPSPTVPLACISVQRAFAESVDGQVAIALLAAVQDEKARAIDEKNRALLAQEQVLQQSRRF